LIPGFVKCSFLGIQQKTTAQGTAQSICTQVALAYYHPRCHTIDDLRVCSKRNLRRTLSGGGNDNSLQCSGSFTE